jgi:RHS repeat-associated protein
MIAPNRVRSQARRHVPLLGFLLIVIVQTPLLSGQVQGTRPTHASDILPTEVGTNGFAAGNTTGALQVSSDGDLVYDFPIWVPAGRNGMQPELSLKYRGRSGNGLLGVGWSLSGLSQIERCARTKAQSGDFRPVTFDSSDQFCLDGQPLLVVNGGVYGADGTEYRTENDMFAKIVSRGVDAWGPISFIVYLRNGRILTYTEGVVGNPLSRMVPDESQPVASTIVGQTIRYSWVMSCAEDRFGNQVSYFYVSKGHFDLTSDYAIELLPDHIVYTDRTDKRWPALKYIQFGYEDRPDAYNIYVSGLQLQYASRLTSIAVSGPELQTGATVVRRTYTFKYEITSITKRSLLTSITECDGAAVCKAPLKFEWEQGLNAFHDFDTGYHDGTNGIVAPPWHFTSIKAVDMNGDGLDDLVMGTGFTPPNLLSWWYLQNTGTYTGQGSRRYFYPTFNQQSAMVPGSPGWTSFIDMDRNGRADILTEFVLCSNNPQSGSGGCPGGGVEYRLNTFPGFSTAASYTNDLMYGFGPPWGPLTLKGYYVADLNGDGYPDLLVAQEDAGGNSNWNYYFGPSFGNMPDGAFAASPAPHNIYTVDVDGIGTPSLLDRSSPSSSSPLGLGLWYVAHRMLSNGAPLPPRNLGLLAGESLNCSSSSGTNCGDTDVFIDLRGDGHPDVLSYDSYNGGDYFFARNTGNGFLDRYETGPEPGATDGSSGFAPPYWINGCGPGIPGCSPNPGIVVADLNADGKQDILITSGANGNTGLAAALGHGWTWPLDPPSYLSAVSDQGVNIIPLPDDPTLITIGDFNGDGLADIAEIVNGELHVYVHMGNRPDVITRIIEGTDEDHTISWSPISDPDVYHLNGTCSFPTVCLNSGIWAVRDVARFDATGGTTHLTYSYANARSDALGRGWLGFEQKEEIDSATGITYQTSYDNYTTKSWQQNQAYGYNYPFVGLPQSDGYNASLELLNSFSDVRFTTYQYVVSNANPAVYSVAPSQVVEKQYDTTYNFAEPFRQTTTTYQYDPFQNPTNVTRTSGDGYKNVKVTDYQNDTSSWLISLPTRTTETDTTPSGEAVTRTVTFGYDSFGGLSELIVEPQGDISVKLTRQFSRDLTGLVTNILESGNNVRRSTQIGYDPLENIWPSYTINALLQREQYTYDPSFGVNVELQDVNNNLTTQQLDGFGRIRTLTPPDGAQTTVSYVSSNTGYSMTVRKAGGQEIESWIDRLGNEQLSNKRAFDASWMSAINLYDAANRLVQTGSTTFTYDSLGRLLRLTHDDGSFVERTYSGPITSSFDELRNQTTTTEDQLGQVIAVNEQLDTSHQVSTRYSYGPFGVLESVADAFGNTSNARYDVLGRRALFVDPDAGPQQIGWNAFNEIVLETNAMGDIFTYQRDALGRPVKIRSKEGTTAIQWDTAPHGIGSVARAISPDGITTSFNYDNLSRLSAETLHIPGQKSYKLSYAYDPLGRLSIISYPPPPSTPTVPVLTIAYEYTPYGAIRAVNDVTTNSPINLWTNTDRNDFGQITGETFANGIATTRQFNSRARLTKITSLKQQTPIQDLQYQYFANGNLSSRTDDLTSVIEGYKYDSLNRLMEWDVNKYDNTGGVVPIAVSEFKYNDIGNLESRTATLGPGTSLTYGYSGIHSGPHAVTSVNGGTFTYDAAGRETGGPGRITKYLSWGLPKSIRGTTQTLTFKYDFERKRVLSSSSNGARIASMRGLFERSWKGTSSAKDTYTVRIGDRVIAAVTWDEIAQGRSVRYLHDDRLGSIATITNENGSVVEERAYDPFGSDRRPDNPTLLTQPPILDGLGFTERQPDQGTGLLNFLGRLYDPAVGRLTTPDLFVNAPFSSQSYNRYSYVANNPLRWIDPTGFQSDQQDVVPTYFPEYGLWGVTVDVGPPPPDWTVWWSLATPAGVADDDTTRYQPSTSQPTSPTTQPASGSQATTAFHGDVPGACFACHYPPGSPGAYFRPKPMTPRRWIEATIPSLAALSVVGAAVGGVYVLEAVYGAEVLVGGGTTATVAGAKAVADTPEGERLALGLSRFLDDFAESQNATTWEDFDDVVNWRPEMMEKLADPDVTKVFNLEGVNAWEGVSRVTAGGNFGPTDWELFQIQQHPEYWPSIQWFLNGQPAPNPFQ